MPSAGKQGVERETLAAAQKAYRQLAAKEERQKRRIAECHIAMNAAMRAFPEAKAYILSTPPKEKQKGMADPQNATVSLINRAVRAIMKARDS
jgi:hypothetical protein